MTTGHLKHCVEGVEELVSTLFETPYEVAVPLDAAGVSDGVELSP
jgi:hypothetical protein